MTAQDTHAFNESDEVAAALRELDLPDDEISALTPVIESLRSWQAPVPTASETRAFLTRLEDTLAVRLIERRAETGTPAVALAASWPRRVALLWRIAWRQPRLIHRSVWAGSLVAIACALGAAWFGTVQQELALGLFMPAIVATCAAFLYGPEVDPSLEYARATPISARFLLGSRLVALLGYEVALGLAATVAIALHQRESFSALVSLWLGPATLLSSCSLFLSLLLGPVIAAGSMFAVWFAQFVQLERTLGTVVLIAPPWQSSPLLFVAAFVILLLGFWLIPTHSRWALPGTMTPENL